MGAMGAFFKVHYQRVREAFPLFSIPPIAGVRVRGEIFVNNARKI